MSNELSIRINNLALPKVSQDNVVKIIAGTEQTLSITLPRQMAIPAAI
jgi:hypothetical protein